MDVKYSLGKRFSWVCFLLAQVYRMSTKAACSLHSFGSRGFRGVGSSPFTEAQVYLDGLCPANRRTFLWIFILSLKSISQIILVTAVIIIKNMLLFGCFVETSVPFAVLAHANLLPLGKYVMKWKTGNASDYPTISSPKAGHPFTFWVEGNRGEPANYIGVLSVFLSAPGLLAPPSTGESASFRWQSRVTGVMLWSNDRCCVNSARTLSMEFIFELILSFLLIQHYACPYDSVLFWLSGNVPLNDETIWFQLGSF